MKAGKKPKGTKARVQAYKKRLGYIGTAITVALLMIAIVISSFLIYARLDSAPNQAINPEQTSNQPSQLKAAIVDHLSLTAPNQTFIQTATNVLKQAGYTVDYYPGEEVTVEFYRNLPTHGYGLIILRVHSALGYVDARLQSGNVDLFTSESYSTTRYIHEQWTDQLGRCRFLGGEQAYFGITPKFVKLSMKERFPNSTIIMMGCDGLTYTTMAHAFIEKGAMVYISWDGGVLSSHTDTATTHLLQHLITEKHTIKQAVTATMTDVGPDPTYKCQLLYYPLEAGNQTVKDNTGNPKTIP